MRGGDALTLLMLAAAFPACESSAAPAPVSAAAMDAGADGRVSVDVSDDGAAPADAPDARPAPTCRPPPEPVAAGLAGLPARLSETGCFAADDPTRPVAELIPYAVNVPLWSDGADKERWLALPEGGRIEVKPDGDWELPPGTVLLKTFRVHGRRVETRFFVRHPGGAWSGYTYAWNEAGTDAALLDEGSQRAPLGEGGTWHFPSRAECNNCHTPAAGFSLGLETAQLDRPLAAGGRNQIEVLAERGLFTAPPARGGPLPAPDDQAAPLETRARAYLHANCAGCHRPGVGNSGTVDLRFATALAQTASCDAEPLKGSLGLGPQMRILAAGKPDDSMVVVRMRLLESGRMPPVASLAVDAAGVKLLSDWIASLVACP
jgi:uncharacterized repeat protein (TIGR03806 family)